MNWQIVFAVIFVFVFILAHFWDLGYFSIYKNINFFKEAYGNINTISESNFMKNFLEDNFFRNRSYFKNNFDYKLAMAYGDFLNLGGPESIDLQKESFQNLELDSSFDIKNWSINFILPTNGINWGKLHSKNAVDIAGSCGLDVVASADGLVIDLKNEGWNNGYGKYIKIEHLDKTQTVYAHLSQINISLGDYVKQGQKIGEVGDSGEASGCHLHFEILGRKNPFVK